MKRPTPEDGEPGREGRDLMLGKKLMGLFGSKTPSAPQAPKPTKLRRANVNRRFTILAQFAEGSMSKVYRALDKETGRSVCLKIQLKDKTAAAVARSAQAIRPSEGEIASQIVHPNVVRTFEFGETNRREYYIVMEYVEGVSLQFLRDARSLTLPRKLDLLTQAGEALAAVHARGFIHHDFGPKNVLVNRDDQVKLIDFGLAVPNTPAFRKPGNRTGTLNYMAPELLRREAIDERIDIFSFGVSAFEILTDKLPYDAAGNNSMAMMLQRINTEPMDPARAAPGLAPELCDWLRKSTARRKEERFRSMTEVVEALQAIPAAVR